MYIKNKTVGHSLTFWALVSGGIFQRNVALILLTNNYILKMFEDILMVSGIK